MITESQRSWLEPAFALPFAWLMVIGCDGPAKNSALETLVPGAGPIAFSLVDDNVAHDTLLVQATFNLGDGTHVMVASHRDDTFEGLRLYHYRARMDSSADVLAISSPAYDSWTMLPTFFRNDSLEATNLWILANFGEKESWGQKLIRLDGLFHDIGFLDIALPERTEEDGSLLLKRRNLAPHARFEFLGDSLWIRFACDSVYLYDDRSGGTDLILSSQRVRYLHVPGEGLSLWVDDRKRLLGEPG